MNTALVWKMEPSCYPLSLDNTTFAKWSQYIVPDGAHKGKTFEQVVACGAGAAYRNRKCSSVWARSLCAYVVAVDHNDLAGAASLLSGWGKDKDDKKGKLHDKNKQDEDSDGEWLEVGQEGQEDKGEKKSVFQTMILKFPPGAEVTVSIK